jgi:hypothetical protein
VVWLLATLFQRWLRRLYGSYLIVATAIFAASLSAIIAVWS